MISYKRAFAVTPDNNNNLAQTAKAFVVGASGTVKVDLVGVGTGLTVQAIAGYVYPMNVKKIYATGTSATGIVGLY